MIRIANPWDPMLDSARWLWVIYPLEDSYKGPLFHLSALKPTITAASILTRIYPGKNWQEVPI